jgi:hypothetical protein
MRVRITLRTLRHLERNQDRLIRATMPRVDRLDPYRPDIKIAGNVPSTATRTLTYRGATYAK